MRYAALILLLALPLWAQKDFLTADEADQVRELQEPNERLKLYLKFARLRIDLVKQLVAKEKAGRSVLIHDTLDEFTQIIEAIDTVSEDALKRRVDLSLGMVAVANAESEMAGHLRVIADTPLKDSARYKFALEQAIETVQDSLDIASEDLKKRGSKVADKLQKEKTDREALMSPQDLASQKQREAKKAEEVKKERKAPTLRRKGEVEQPKP
jgi:hypothetical protein